MKDIPIDRETGLKIGLIALVLGLVLFFLFPFYPVNKVVNLGLDLRGGIRIVLQAEGVKKMSPEEQDRAINKIVTILNNRVNQYGLSEPNIAPLGESRVLVELPGTTKKQTARRLIGKTAMLEFKKVVKVGRPGEELIPQNPSQQVLWGREQKVQYLVQETPLMTGKVLANAEVRTSSRTQNPIYVSLKFNQQGAKKFADVIRRLQAGQDRIAIVLDGVVQSAPVISQGIAETAQTQDKIQRATIEGDFSTKEAKQLSIVLRAGALPVDVNIVRSTSVGPTLGADAIRAGMITIVVGFLLILLFMPFRYKFLGVVADLVLIFNMLIMFGGLSMLRATLTLPGIAGIILTIGISVDANIIIFERIKEERINGKSPSAAVRSGFDKSLSTVLDANLTTLATAFILIYFGGGPVKGFGITLAIGIVGSLFCALLVTRLLLEETFFGDHIPVKATSVSQ